VSRKLLAGDKPLSTRETLRVLGLNRLLAPLSEEESAMKRFTLCSLVFACGVTCGASVSFASKIQQAYLRGISDGLHSCRREAVHSGHGRWTFKSPSGPIGFEWLPVLEHYKPDTRINAPGVLD